MFSVSTLAGLPDATLWGGTSETTTAPAPAIAFAPTDTPGARTAPAPIKAPGPTRQSPHRMHPGPRLAKSSTTESWPTDTERFKDTKRPSVTLAPTDPLEFTTTPSPIFTLRATTVVGSTTDGKVRKPFDLASNSSDCRCPGVVSTNTAGRSTALGLRSARSTTGERPSGR